jgi:chaperonin GroEL
MKYIVTKEKEDLLKFKKGIETLAEVVATTMGPLGKNVIIRRPNGKVHVTKDGVTVAKAVQSNDPIEQMGIDLVREVALNTLLDAGDGTTTATILTNAFIEAIEKYRNEIEHVTKVKTEINELVEKVVEDIRSRSLDIKENIEAIKAVATISANNDLNIGELISDAFASIGTTGNIIVEEAKGEETYVRLSDGFFFERGYVSKAFLPNNSKKIELENPYILIYDKRIDNVNQIAGILTQVFNEKNNRPLLIICESLEGSALSSVLVNHKKGILKAAAVIAPGYAARRLELLEDIALFTDGNFIDTQLGMTLSTAKLRDLGIAEKVIIDGNSTTIIGGKGDKEKINAKINELSESLKTEKSKYQREKLNERIASLSKGVGVIYVGGSSEVEMKESKDRIDDALHATKAALSEGVVDGGGITYLNAGLKILKKPNNVAQKILMEALLRPVFNIYGEELEFEIYPFNEPMNLKTGVKGKGIEIGVIDPTKVSITALKNAASVATMYLTTGALITQSVMLFEEEEKEELV